MKKWLIVFLFLVRVKIPMGTDLTYRDVKSVTATDRGYYALVLSDDRTAFVPIMWTCIEYQKEHSK